MLVARRMLDFLFHPEKKRREKLRAEPLAPELVAMIERNFPYYQHLSEDERKELHGHVNVFLAEKSFEGCGGLEITDEIRVTIAAQACVLLLHRETDYFPECSAILVYPTTFVAMATRTEGGIVIEGEEARLGESHARGLVVLAWDDVRRGARDLADGHNVVFHEFAHQLDQEHGPADGAPELPRSSMYAPWARVLGEEYAHLQAAIERHRKTVIDAYGATSPAEFFAVVSETFFEKPRQLQAKHPELYALFRDFYKQDPGARS
jgi:Mlc titration factor MtfA (ptsG expression regulator)